MSSGCTTAGSTLAQWVAAARWSLLTQFFRLSGIRPEKREGGGGGGGGKRWGLLRKPPGPGEALIGKGPPPQAHNPQAERAAPVWAGSPLKLRDPQPQAGDLSSLVPAQTRGFRADGPAQEARTQTSSKVRRKTHELTPPGQRRRVRDTKPRTPAFRVCGVETSGPAGSCLLPRPTCAAPNLCPAPKAPTGAWAPHSHAPHPLTPPADGRSPAPPTCDGSPDLPGRLLTHLDGGLLAVPGRMRGADQVGRVLQGALAKAAKRSEAKGQSLTLATAHPHLSDLPSPSLTTAGRVSTGDTPSPL